MRLDPVADLPPPPLGSKWRDVVTGHVGTVAGFGRFLGRYVMTVTMEMDHRPGEQVVLQVVLFTRFRDQFEPES